MTAREATERLLATDQTAFPAHRKESARVPSLHTLARPEAVQGRLSALRATPVPSLPGGLGVKQLPGPLASQSPEPVCSLRILRMLRSQLRRSPRSDAGGLSNHLELLPATRCLSRLGTKPFKRSPRPGGVALIQRRSRRGGARLSGQTMWRAGAGGVPLRKRARAPRRPAAFGEFRRTAAESRIRKECSVAGEGDTASDRGT